MRRLWKELGRVSAAILAIYGILMVGPDIYGHTKSFTVAAIASIAIALTLGISAFLYLVPSPLQRKMGVSRYPTKSVISTRYSLIAIDQHFRATIKRVSELVFFKEPQQEDLIDTIDLLPGEEMHERHYSSEDSDIADVRRRNDNTLVVYWQPKTPIHSLLPYRHEMTYVSPTLYGDDAFYHSILFDRLVGASLLEIQSENEIEEVLAFTMPPWSAGVTIKSLYRHYCSRQQRGCDQPKLDTTGHRISWTLKTPKLGRIYVLFAIYKGERERYIQGSRNLFWFRPPIAIDKNISLDDTKRTLP